MKKQEKPPLGLLKEALHYNPRTGVFTWRDSRQGRVKVGMRAGTIHPRNKRRYIKFGGTAYFASRLAIYYMTGEWPHDLQVDHINRDRSDDSYANLRLVTSAQNQWNTVARVNNRLGEKGVYFDKRLEKYVAHIRVEGKSKHLGCYKTIDEAIAARNGAAMIAHGRFMPVSD